VKHALLAFFVLLLGATVAERARADEPDVYVTGTVFGGYGFWSRGKNVPIGYSAGVTIDRHAYVGAGLTGVLGLAKGRPDGTIVYDNAIYISADTGYETVVDDHLLLRGGLSIGSLLCMHGEGADYATAEITARQSRFAVAPSFLVGGIVGPIVLGVQSRAILAAGAPEVSSFGATFVVGWHITML